MKIRVICGQNPISASWNIRVNSRNSWVTPYQRKLKHSCQFVQFVPIRTIRGQTPSAQAETHIKTKIDNISFQQTLSKSQALSNSNKQIICFIKLPVSSQFLWASLRPLINHILILLLHNENISNRRSWLCRFKPLWSLSQRPSKRRLIIRQLLYRKPRQPRARSNLHRR